MYNDVHKVHTMQIRRRPICFVYASSPTTRAGLQRLIENTKRACEVSASIHRERDVNVIYIAPVQYYIIICRSCQENNTVTAHFWQVPYCFKAVPALHLMNSSPVLRRWLISAFLNKKTRLSRKARLLSSKLSLKLPAIVIIDFWYVSQHRWDIICSTTELHRH
jgi:hypothetical protein